MHRLESARDGLLRRRWKREPGQRIEGEARRADELAMEPRQTLGRAARFEILRRALEALLAARADRDVGALLGERLRDGEPDAAARGGDEGLLSFETEIHFFSP